MKATLEPDNRAAQRDSSARSDYYLNLANHSGVKMIKQEDLPAFRLNMN